MQFKFSLYQYSFKQPLHTSHGIWRVREGIIISLSNGASIGQGEIAPLSWFGSETLAQALEFCQQLPENISESDIARIPNSLPCCQFAFESALLDLNSSQSHFHESNLEYCYLLPAGKKALTSWQDTYHQKHNNTFKWKIGVYPLEEELEILQQLAKTLPPPVKLRLDANGGLNLAEARRLLATTDKLRNIEFVEQPISPDSFAQIQQLSQEYKTPLALDESVACLQQLQLIHQQGWKGVFVIKASIMGFPSLLINYCQKYSLDVVFSSVFETNVGRNAVLKLAQQLNHPRAFGFGINVQQIS